MSSGSTKLLCSIIRLFNHRHWFELNFEWIWPGSSLLLFLGSTRSHQWKYHLLEILGPFCQNVFSDGMSSQKESREAILISMGIVVVDQMSYSTDWFWRTGWRSINGQWLSTFASLSSLYGFFLLQLTFQLWLPALHIPRYFNLHSSPELPLFQ